MNWIEIGSIILGSGVSGGWLFNLITLKSRKRKSNAEANTSELDNVQEAIKIWREMAEGMKAERDEYKTNFLSVSKHNAEMADQLEKIRKELTKLSAINNKMVKLLDKITPDNLTEMVDKIKKCHETD